MKLSIFKRPTTFFILAFILAFSISFLVIFIVEKQVREVKLNEVKVNESRVVNLENGLLSRESTRILSDLYYLHYAFENELYASAGLDQTAANWMEFSRQRKIYDQIRYIDAEGDETIRINYANNDSNLVDRYALQNKRDRYYFYNTAQLSEDSVYVSPLDLNIENAEIELPYKPIIRFSTPLYDGTGNFQGIIILNYLAEDLLGRFKEFGENSVGKVMLLNQEGYWLTCEDTANEWNFMFEEKRENTFGKMYPEEWDKLLQGQTQFITENGLFTSIHVNRNYINVADHQANTVSNIIAEEEEWLIVSIVDSDSPAATYLLDDTGLLILDILKKNAYFFAIIAVVSFIISLFVYLNRKAYERIKYYSEHDPLTKLYNRRAGYNFLNKLSQRENKRQLSLSICFIDINGLKLVNDHLGHEYGDELLVSVANVLNANIRENDFAVRFGGDEFVLFLSGTSEEQAEALWGRIISQFQEINDCEQRPYLISASHGIVSYSNNQEIPIDDLIKSADAIMYKEKDVIKKGLEILRKNLEG